MTGFAYQLYSSRNFLPLESTLAMLSEAGYTAVEGYGALVADEDRVAALELALAKSNLSMPTCHVGLDQIQTDPTGVISFAEQLGIKTIIAPYLPPEDRPLDSDGWRTFAKELADASRPLVDAGLTFGWHNHDFEFETLQTGEHILDLLLGGGDHVMFEFDVAWAVRAGQEPQFWIDRYGGRLCAAHIKDIAREGEAANEDGWADVGYGTVDWKTLLAALKDKGVSSFIVEHDNPSDDRRFATRSIETLRAFDA
ncbi:MAG: sugar phosphate isomerase/epimerase family protein [Cohaesibacteraceae bacterium]